MKFFLPLHKAFFFMVFVVLTALASRAYGQSRPLQNEVNLEKKFIDGKKYQLLGDLEKAETTFRSILEEDVNNTAAQYELSRTLTAKRSYQDALTYIKKAIRLEPNNEWYLLMEADIHEKTGDLFAAMEIYDRLIQLRPDRT